MLPLSVSTYLPHVGLLLVITGLIFVIVATAEYKSSSNSSGGSSSSVKFTNLGYGLILSGGFMLLGPFR